MSVETMCYALRKKGRT